jgi:hypothetical protein
MAGGLLNLLAEGQTNVILNGNPTKSFWKVKYAKYTNFGQQHFRLDYDGVPSLRLTEESTFSFKIKRYADLLKDAFVSVTLPNIWSTIIPPQYDHTTEKYTDWAPYEFKWIEYLGALMIKKITITCGNQTLQEYGGQYLLAMVQRDFSESKKQLFYRMIGHLNDLYDPANAGGHVNTYPNSYYIPNSTVGCQPSIMGRVLHIPLGAFFTLKPQNAFPLICLQYNELKIHITFRPINQICRIRDVNDFPNNYPYVAPNFNNEKMLFYRFLQTPPSVELQTDDYIDKRSLWDPDIHLNCTYIFLSDEEHDLFAKTNQTYLITQPFEREYYDIVGTQKININSLGLIKSWMFYLRRSDVKLRNEWSNYTNWAQNYIPLDSVHGSEAKATYELNGYTLTPGMNIDQENTNMFINLEYSNANTKKILIQMGILLDGMYRENTITSDIYDYIQKYTQTEGNAPEGIYCYNFCLHTSPFQTQPSGAINMAKFKNIEFEIVTIQPPLNPYVQTDVICDETGVIGINKPIRGIYEYTFDMVLFEEKMNLVQFIGGNVSMLYAN